MAMPTSLEGRGRVGHQSKRFIREVLGLQDATFGHTEHDTSQPETACLYGFGSRTDVGRNLIPRVVKRLLYGFELGRIERRSGEKSAGLHVVPQGSQ